MGLRISHGGRHPRVTGQVSTNGLADSDFPGHRWLGAKAVHYGAEGPLGKTAPHDDLAKHERRGRGQQQRSERYLPGVWLGVFEIDRNARHEHHRPDSFPPLHPGWRPAASIAKELERNPDT